MGIIIGKRDTNSKLGSLGISKLFLLIKEYKRVMDFLNPLSRLHIISNPTIDLLSRTSILLSRGPYISHNLHSDPGKIFNNSMF